MIQTKMATGWSSMMDPRAASLCTICTCMSWAASKLAGQQFEQANVCELWSGRNSVSWDEVMVYIDECAHVQCTHARDLGEAAELSRAPVQSCKLIVQRALLGIGVAIVDW
jgi:hypothetical protein